MAKWMLMVESNCKDPAREDEFNNWYNNIHFPDILETLGFLRATRYEITQPVEDKGKFVAVYEIEADNIDNFLAAHRANMKQKEAQGRMTDLIKVVSRAIYKQVNTMHGKV